MALDRSNTTTTALADSVDNYYQISDDDMDDCDDLADDCLLEEVDEPSGVSNGHGNVSRGPYERAWTTDATRALINVRGPMEGSFTEGRQKRTALWLHCTRQLQKMGFRYSAAKVQKKWHNILITYNKNLCKKYSTGYVHWEFFEDMFKYLQGKKADYGYQRHKGHANELSNGNGAPQFEVPPQQSTPLYSKAHSIQSKPREIDEFDDDDEDDSASMPGLKRPKLELNENELPLELAFLQNAQATHATPVGTNFPQMTFPEQDEHHTDWWKEYFEQKLQVEREKVQLQREMHRDLMQFNKAKMVQEERIERSRVDVLTNLASTLQKFVDIRSRKA